MCRIYNTSLVNVIISIQKQLNLRQKMYIYGSNELMYLILFSELQISDIQEMLGDAVNNLVKHFYKPEKEVSITHTETPIDCFIKCTYPVLSDALRFLYGI